MSQVCTVKSKLFLVRSLQVRVKTSDLRGAGTDANVEMSMYGEYEGARRESGPHKLDNSANNFERAMTDDFAIKTRDLGELKYITVSVQMARDALCYAGLYAWWCRLRPMCFPARIHLRCQTQPTTPHMHHKSLAWPGWVTKLHSNASCDARPLLALYL